MWENTVYDSKDSDKIVTVKCRTMQQRLKVKAVIDVVQRRRVKAKVREVELRETEVTTMVEMMILKSKSPQRWVVTSLRMIQKSMPRTGKEWMRQLRRRSRCLQKEWPWQRWFSGRWICQCLDLNLTYNLLNLLLLILFGSLFSRGGTGNIPMKSLLVTSERTFI